ncbi:ROK family protein [Altererythrobacter indicus]|uniref:fructokinase n=1 Tax=Altericroceibacterium indicum TaxID=374177 RepID=A0A845AHX9_9SPHN|nr:ROK family protein [Altericroceibacterium indicum]MXP26718.1 ROK family protein [Altericroceibacterium indicum]
MTGKALRLGGIELGGTKSIAILSDGESILERATFPTRSPSETLPLLSAQLRNWNREASLDALGIASFGPLQLNKAAAGFGKMLPTPKPGWEGAEITTTLSGGLTCPFAIDTDVNGAGLAEYCWGAGRNCSSLCYITIGTGVGGGLIVNGAPVHGAMHPEIGHMRIRRVAEDQFGGACPFHGDCLEGLVSGPALAARFGCDPATVGEDDPRWTYVASDISEMAVNLLLTCSVQRILIGGGVGMGRAKLLPKVRQLTVERLAGYLPFATPETIDTIIVAPELGDNAGPMGTVALALDALSQ